MNLSTPEDAKRQRRVLSLLHFDSARFRSRLKSGMTAVALALQERHRPYISFSCGKDSVVVAALVHALIPEVPLLWSDAELELPETVDYAARLKEIAGEQFLIVRSTSTHAGWFASWGEKPYFREPLPGTLCIPAPLDPVPGQSSKDDWMATRSHDLVFLGTRAGESCKRRDWLTSTGGLYHSRTGTGRRCCPIWDWNEDDVWALIHGWRLGYNPAYDALEAARIPRERQRVAPLPLSPRWILAEVWPDLLERLEARYGRRWD